MALSPVDDPTRNLMLCARYVPCRYYKISSADFKFPGYPIFTAEEQDFVKKLLTVEVDNRLGKVNSGMEVFGHPFFAGMDVDSLRAQKLESPLLSLVGAQPTEPIEGDADAAAACLQWTGAGDDAFGCTFSHF